MNAIIDFNKIALGAMLAATPFLAACGSLQHQSLIPQSQPLAVQAASAAACEWDCAVLLEPLRATIVNGVLELAREPVACSGTTLSSAGEISVPAGTEVTIDAAVLPFACPSEGRLPNGYFIVAVPGPVPAEVRGTPVSSFPLDGPNVEPAAAKTLAFAESRIGIPSGKVGFYLAYCATCIHTK